MAANVFFSQNKSSSRERDSLTPCNMHLNPCKYIARLLECKVNGDLFRYIINTYIIKTCYQKLMDMNKRSNKCPSKNCAILHLHFNEELFHTTSINTYLEKKTNESSVS